MRAALTTSTVVLLTAILSACAPEVGTKAWCEDMEDKPTGDWSANDAKAYAKHCVFENYVDDED